MTTKAARPTKRPASPDTLTERDADIMTDLYFTRSMSAGQIYWLHFTSEQRTRARLAELVNQKGYLARYKYYDRFDPNPTCYHLTPKAYDYVEDSLLGLKADRPRRIKDPRVAQRNLPHHLDTVDLYSEIRHELNRVLGPYPAWHWVNEERAYRPYSVATVETAYNPDAEVLFDDGRRFIVERQTERKKIGGKRLRDKLAAHNEWVSLQVEMRKYEEGKTTLLFCCDTKAQMDLTRIAARDLKLSIPVYVGDVYYCGEHIRKAARTQIL